MVCDSMIEGLTMMSNNKPDPICEPCLAGKMHANPFPSKNWSTKLLQLVHTDVHKVGATTHSGYQYSLITILNFVLYPLYRQRTWCLMHSNNSKLMLRIKLVIKSKH